MQNRGIGIESSPIGNEGFALSKAKAKPLKPCLLLSIISWGSSCLCLDSGDDPLGFSRCEPLVAAILLAGSRGCGSSRKVTQ